MNDSNSHTEISDQIAGLQRQVFILLLALIVVSGTLTVYLYRQASLTRRDLTSIKPQAIPIINAYYQNYASVTNFVGQLRAYGAMHPDFQPILKKYQIPPASAAPGK